MEEIKQKVPDLYESLSEDLRDKNWAEIKSDLEKLNWLSFGSPVETFKHYIELTDFYGVFVIYQGEKLSILKTINVAYFINTLIFQETNKQNIKEMIGFITEYLIKARFFKVSREKVSKKTEEIEDVLQHIIEVFKEIFELWMIALMHISVKFEKIHKKDIQTYLKDLFHHEVLLTVQYSYSSNKAVRNLTSEFETRSTGYNRNYTQKPFKHLYFGEVNENNNAREGFGRLSLDNGDRYEGEFRNDLMNGYGVYVFKKKDWYKGEFSDGEIHGKGTRMFLDGTVYEGEFCRGKMHGEGKLTFKNQDVYAGKFNSDYISGEGEYFWHKSQDKFNGIFKYDQKSLGILTLSTGETIKI